MNGKRLEVLVVEDNPGDACLIEEMLDDLKLELKVTMAKDGQEALSILSDGRGNVPNLIILDLNLPKVDGFDVLKYMKESRKLSVIPVVVMTGSIRIEDEKRCRELGAVDYCIKPATSEEMDGTTLRLGKNLQPRPTKGKTDDLDTTESMDQTYFQLLFQHSLMPYYAMERTNIDFQNIDHWDLWK